MKTIRFTVPALRWSCGARSDEQEQVETRRIRLQAQWYAGQAVEPDEGHNDDEGGDLLVRR